jgi:hypothetical protein
MPIASRISIAAVLLVSATAAAQEATEPAAGDAPITQIASVTLQNGVQGSNHDALQGFQQTVVFGFRVTRPRSTFQEFFEAGISRLDTFDSPLVTSSALVGARLAWRWDRFALHFLARFHHGDAMTGDDGVAIYSHAVSVGLMGSFDVLRVHDTSVAVALHTLGEFHSASDGNESTLASAGGGGISLVAW